MKAILGLILSEDGSIRDISLLANNRDDRKLAHEMLFILQDAIDDFEKVAKERIGSVPQVRPGSLL